MARCKLNAEQRKELRKLITDFDNARAALYDRLDEIETDWQEEFNEASDRWRDSQGGQDAQGRLDAIAEARDSIEENPTIDLDDL